MWGMVWVRGQRRPLVWVEGTRGTSPPARSSTTWPAYITTTGRRYRRRRPSRSHDKDRHFPRCFQFSQTIEGFGLTVTSKAVVGSSANRSLGSPANARLSLAAVPCRQKAHVGNGGRQLRGWEDGRWQEVGPPGPVLRPSAHRGEGGPPPEVAGPLGTPGPNRSWFPGRRGRSRSRGSRQVLSPTPRQVPAENHTFLLLGGQCRVAGRVWR